MGDIDNVKSTHDTPAIISFLGLSMVKVISISDPTGIELTWSFAD